MKLVIDIKNTKQVIACMGDGSLFSPEVSLSAGIDSLDSFVWFFRQVHPNSNLIIKTPQIKLVEDGDKVLVQDRKNRCLGCGCIGNSTLRWKFIKRRLMK